MATAQIPATEFPERQEWKDFLEDFLPAQGTWTEEHYLISTDYTNHLVEFTDGFLEPVPMPTDQHQSVLQLLFLAFFNFVNPAAAWCYSRD